MKIPNKKELQQIASNHSSDIEFKAFMKLCKDYTKKPFLYDFAIRQSINPSRPVPFKALRAFIKPFEAPQRSVKIKI